MNQLSELPACLEGRPVDERRGLPIPFVHQADDGRHDFTVLLAERVYECVNKQVCSQCGKPLGYWMAFLSGPVSAGTRAFTDPPMHPDCAEAAIMLCPHMNRVAMKRAVNRTISGEVAKSNPGAIIEHPGVWVICVTRGYSMTQTPDGNALLFLARTFRRMHGYRCLEDRPGMEPMTEAELKAEVRARVLEVPAGRRGDFREKDWKQ